MALRTVHFRLLPQTIEMTLEDGTPVALPIGPTTLTERVFRHDPPRAVELEHAIDLVEDALARWPASVSMGGVLSADVPALRTLPGLTSPGAALHRAQVETLFQRLASRALGTPVADSELPSGRDLAAALLILRECMHHLGFEQVVAGIAPSPAPS